MRLGEVLFGRLRELGVKHLFGVPGDFALPLFEAARESGVEVVGVTHEPSAGFAADAYARLRGCGGALVTYGAGGLNLVNAAAQAYAEKSPVVIVSGAPEVRFLSTEALLHHRVKTFETQRGVFSEVCAAAVVLDDPKTALPRLDSALAECVRKHLPVYIEVPRDMVASDLGRVPPLALEPRPVPREALEELMEEAAGRLNLSRSPVLYAGVEIERLKLSEELVRLAEKLNLPCATSLMGKAVFPETHPNFVGTYMGQVGPELPRGLVEGSDCLLMLGVLASDTNTGNFTARVDARRSIRSSADGTEVSHHRYDGVGLEDFLSALLAREGLKTHELPPPGAPAPGPADGPAGVLTMSRVLVKVNELARSKEWCVICDCGDALFSCAELASDMLLAPAYYASMGFAVPAALGAGLARRERRPLVLVGDGAFQMTGGELSTLRAKGVRALVLLIDNASYATLSQLGGREYPIPRWDYVQFARALGCDGAAAEAPGAFERAVREGVASEKPFVVSCRVPPSLCSRVLKRMGEQARARGS